MIAQESRFSYFFFEILYTFGNSLRQKQGMFILYMQYYNLNRIICLKCIVYWDTNVWFSNFLMNSKQDNPCLNTKRVSSFRFRDLLEQILQTENVNTFDASFKITFVNCCLCVWPFIHFLTRPLIENRVF